MNPDILKERKGSSCTPKDLSILLMGGPSQYERRKFIESLIAADPLFDDSNRYHQTNEERYDNGVKRAVQWEKMRKQHHLPDDAILDFYSIFNNDLAFAIHEAMFLPMIRRLGNPEQLAKWLPLAESRQIIGTYAQTELGHGSYLNGLETTATFDRERQEFVLNTPSISSMKWWPGGLGLTVNHTVVMAQLVIDGHRCGVQAFILQLRDRGTHQLLPGCQAGDVGPKWGRNGVSNGFLRLHNVRIPRENMLSKYVEVTPDGELTSHGNPKVQYGTLILMRTRLVQAAAMHLSMAVTIAIRYSAVRRQGTIDASDGEVQVLDYQSQQDMLFPLLAASYCFSFVAQRLQQVYLDSESLIKAGDFSQLPELHSLTCALKAYCCNYMSEGTRTCIYSCGGHGYLLSSGLPWLYECNSVRSTTEGDKQVLYLQTARALIKSLDNNLNIKVNPGKPKTTDYLFAEVTSKWQPQFRGHVRDHGNLIKALQHRSQRLVMQAANRVKSLKQEGLSQSRAWNQSQVYLIAAAKAHAELYCVEVFCGRVKTLLDVSPAIRNAFQRLCLLYALSIIRTNSGEFLQSVALEMRGSSPGCMVHTKDLKMEHLDALRQLLEYGKQASDLKIRLWTALDRFVSSQQMLWVSEEYFSLLKEIRPDAVVLVDGFNYSDATLRSTLGSYDGNAYQRLYESTKDEPRNQKPVHDVFHKYLRPFMQEQAKL